MATTLGRARRELQEGVCEDTPVGWIDGEETMGYNCTTWAAAGLCGPSGVHGDDPAYKGSDGQTPNQACCGCGGGRDLATLCDSCVCPGGSYCSSSVVYPCPVGTFNPDEGATTSIDACTDCSVPGTFCPEGSTTNGDPCPTGSYCLNPGSVLECPAGTYNSNEGATSADACVACSAVAGKYCPEGSTSDGAPCAQGGFCPAFKTRIDALPSGNAQSKHGCVERRCVS